MGQPPRGKLNFRSESHDARSPSRRGFACFSAEEWTPVGIPHQLNLRFLGPECGSRGTGSVGEVAVDLSLHLRHDLSSEQVHALKG